MLPGKGGYQMEEDLRKKAISRYCKGEKPKSIYRDLKRSKYWFFKWLKRYQSGVPEWFKDKLRTPVNQPSALSKIEKERIINVRKHLESQKFTQIGVSAIKWELRKSGFTIPSDSTINRVLKREGLVKKNFVYPQRGWVSIFHWSAELQQHSPSGSVGATVHQKRWQILLLQCNRPI